MLQLGNHVDKQKGASFSFAPKKLIPVQFSERPDEFPNKIDVNQNKEKETSLPFPPIEKPMESHFHPKQMEPLGH